MSDDLDLRRLPDEYVLPMARLKVLAIMAFASVLLLGGVWIDPRNHMMSLYITIFFGLVIAVFVAAIFGGFRILLQRDGFEVRNLFRTKTYAWRDVSEITHAHVGRSSMILFNDTSRPDTAHGLFRRMLKGYNSGFPAGLLAGSLDTVCARMNAFRARALRKP